MPVRDVLDRLAAIEALLIQSLADRFAKQMNPARSLMAFSDGVYDVAGRNEAVQALLEMIDRRRKHIEANRGPR